MTILGEKQVMNRLKSIQGDIRPKIKAATMSGCNIIRNEAQEKAPYRTGNLKRSIRTEPVETKADEVFGLIGTDVEYAKAMEYGGSKQAPNGYLRIALDMKGEEAMKEIRDVLKILIR